MSKITTSAKKLSVVLASVAAASAVGVAFASWTSGGLGSASATSTTSKESVIAAGTFADDLYPGALKSVTVTVSNPNDYPVVVTQISDGSSAAVNGCAAGSVFSTGLGTATSSDPLAQDAGAGTTIAANGSGVYRLETRMIGDATNACKAQTFSLDLTARVQSAAVTAS
jgi:hypothetical protein